jgi:hypothetical protein
MRLLCRKLVKRITAQNTCAYFGLVEPNLKVGNQPNLDACDTLLESSRRELQFFFKPHPNRRFQQRVIVPQSGRSPKHGSFRTPLWESWDKKPFECRCRRKTQIILYGGRWWLPPSPGRGESCESRVARGLS